MAIRVWQAPHLCSKLNTRGQRSRLLFFTLIAIFNFVIYFPSFFHVARADQIVYLADMATTHGWLSLVAKSYAYERVREFNPGDEIAFRPIFFFIIALEKWLFGYHFMSWQIVSFILHLVVVWWLLKLLMEIERSILAPLLCLFFSTLFVSIEMVIWHHLHGYQVFSVFTLAALYHLYAHLREGKMKLWRVWTITGFLLLAAFSYEMGMLLSVIASFYLGLSYWGEQTGDGDPPKLKSWSAAVLLLPCVLYVVASASDFAVRGATAPEGYVIWNKLDVGTTTRNVIYTDALWFLGGVFPVGLNAIPQERIIMQPPNALPWHDAGKMSQLVLSIILGVALVTTYAVVFMKGMAKEFLQERCPMIFVLLSLIIAYTLMIVVGRINPRGFITLTYSIYYSYIFWIFLIVLIFITINFSILDKILSTGMKVTTLCLLMILIYTNSSLVHEMNWQMTAFSEPRRLLIKYIETVKQQITGDDKLVIGCRALHPGNPLIMWLRKRGDPPDRWYTFLEALYPESCQGLGAQPAGLDGQAD